MKLRRKLSLLGAGLLLGLLAIFLLRGPLTHAAVTAGLQRVGAGDITMVVAHSSPWLLKLENLAFKIKTQSFTASRITMERRHWWQPTLGAVRIEGVKVPVTLDGSDANPHAWANYSGEAAAGGGGAAVPIETLSVDGQLILRTAGHEQPVELKFAAHPTPAGAWSGTMNLTGPGLLLDAEASYDLGAKRLEFHTTALSVELAPWQEAVQRVVVVPMGPWTVAGRLTGNFSGTYAEQKFALSGRIKLSEGSLKNGDGKLSAEGAESDFEFTDLNHLLSKPGTLRVRELRAGTFVANDLDAELAFLSAEHFAIHRLSLKTLGGSLSAEPFSLALEKQELEAVLLVDNLDVEKIIALTKDLPAKASGRVDGRLPVRIDEHGLRLGTGWLQLKKGVYAEMQLRADGILTGGMSPKSDQYVIMKRIESGLMRLKLGELRLDVRPPNAERGRSARLHLEGVPVDPSVKMPVIFDFNVNGPLEELLNFGLKSNVSFGVGK